MNTKSFALKSLIALGAFAALSTSAVAGPRAMGHVKPFDGARGRAVARTTAFANPVTPTGYSNAKLFVRKSGGQRED